jgi:type I restriction enzyme S subunit
MEMFGDPEQNPFDFPIVNLGTVLTVEPQNGLYKPQSDYVKDGTGVPILRIDGFYNGKVTDFCKLKRLQCTDLEKERYLLNENDIVINRVHSIEYLVKCALIRGLLEETVFESNMMRFHIDESKFNATYITYLLCTKFIYNQILNRAKKAVNQASINQKDVRSFQIYTPTLELQNQFAAFVEQVDKSKLEVKQALDKAEMLKNSLMQEYFG